MEEEFDFECVSCGGSCTILHSGKDTPTFCPFCGVEHTSPAEELGYEDPDNAEYE